jgi:hypothetical protein
MNKIKEWLEQLKLVFEKRTVDAIFPPVVFFLMNQWLSIEYASGITLGLLMVLIIYRKVKGQTEKYAFVGVGGVLLSIGFSLLSGEAIDYYIPDLLMTGLIVIACFVSLIIRRPLAALLSHLTRGWPIGWYMRKDVQPAYKRVTIIWGIYFLIRLILQGFLFLRREYTGYFLVNTILGMPMNIFILIISYVYGVAILRKLSGPSVDEYTNEKEPPYEGQKSGF